MSDTDGDGFDDADEVSQGTDPTDPNSYPGAPVNVPGLTAWGATFLAMAMAMSSVAWLAMPRRRQEIG
jgi:hypothetical protein